MMWISVEDSLPKLLQKVLFSWVIKDSNGAISVKNISMGYRCEQGWDIYLPYHSFGLRNNICPVTHWMELPNYPEIEIHEKWTGEIIIDDPLANAIPIEKSVEKGTSEAREFAEKIIEKNKELFKRLADK